MNILIADDHSSVRHGLALLTAQTLGEECIIDFAQSGDEALICLAQKKYFLFISDFMMPDQRGVGLIGMALELQPLLRIIIISSGAEHDFADQCILKGAHAYIHKGASDMAFSKVIRTVAYESDNYHAHKRKETLDAIAGKDPGIDLNFFSYSRTENGK